MTISTVYLLTLTFKGPKVFAFLQQVPAGHTQVFSEINYLHGDSSSALCFGRANLGKTPEHRQEVSAVWGARHYDCHLTAAYNSWDPVGAPLVSASTTATGKCSTRQPAAALNQAGGGGVGILKAFSQPLKIHVSCERIIRIPHLN